MQKIEDCNGVILLVHDIALVSDVQYGLQRCNLGPAMRVLGRRAQPLSRMLGSSAMNVQIQMAP